MSAPQYLPNQENLVSHSKKLRVYYFIDEAGKKKHKSREESIDTKTIVVYPYSVSNRFGFTQPKIKSLTFIGWNDLGSLPRDFRITRGYGYKSQRIRTLISFLNRRFRKLSSIIIGINHKTKITQQSITFKWSDLQSILVSLDRDKERNAKGRRQLLEENLSKYTTSILRPSRPMEPGVLESYLSQFTDFTKLSIRDLNALSHIIDRMPASKISVTSHFIETRDRIDSVFLEDLISEFEALLAGKTEKEEKWQTFFQKNAWLLTHLFPYQVILRKGKAYIGGKTIENEEGRIVDFLFQSGLKDNFALLEIKTHHASLLNKTVYRDPHVFVMSDELSGGINQCLDQKDTYLKDFGRRDEPLDPKCILVIGQKNMLSDNQVKCFELIRSNQKNVDIVTYDELLTKLKGLHAVLSGKQLLKHAI